MLMVNLLDYHSRMITYTDHMSWVVSPWWMIQIITERLTHTKAEQKVSESKTWWCEPPAVFQSEWRSWYDFESGFRLHRIWSSTREREELKEICIFAKSSPPLWNSIKSVSLKPKNLVPILQEESLPRCDRGDREYYVLHVTLFSGMGMVKIQKKKMTSLGMSFHKITSSLHCQNWKLMKLFTVHYRVHDASYSKLSEARKMHLMCLSHWFRAGWPSIIWCDNYEMGSDFMVMKSMKQINTLIRLKKGQQMEPMAEIQKIVT